MHAVFEKLARNVEMRGRWCRYCDGVDSIEQVMVVSHAFRAEFIGYRAAALTVDIADAYQPNALDSSELRRVALPLNSYSYYGGPDHRHDALDVCPTDCVAGSCGTAALKSTSRPKCHPI